MTPLGKRGGSHLTVSSTTSLSSKSVILWAVMLVSGEGAMGGASRLQVVLLEQAVLSRIAREYHRVLVAIQVAPL